MKPIVLYTTEPCSFCRRVKDLLSARGLEFDEVNLSRDPAGRIELVQRTGMMSFPQVVIDGELLGGAREVMEADQTGRLDELLAA
jgi:glutaredoxin 3